MIISQYHGFKVSWYHYKEKTNLRGKFTKYVQLFIASFPACPHILHCKYDYRWLNGLLLQKPGPIHNPV